MSSTKIVVLLLAAIVAVTSATSSHSHHHHHYYGAVSNSYGPQPAPYGGEDHGEDHHEEEEHDDEEDHRVWRFQMGDNFGAYEYVDDEGYLRGFTIDLLRAVCQHAGKRCAYTVDRYSRCWETQKGIEMPGVGLLDQWYDGCIGLYPSADRLNAFNFSVPYTANMQAGLHFRENDIIEDATNITGLKIGFTEGWVMSGRCLNRQPGFVGNNEHDYTPVFFETHGEMVEALKAHKIDALMSADAFDAEHFHLKVPGNWFKCSLGGASVMTRYLDDVITWWNDAFEEMRDSGAYRRLCDEAAVRHGAHGKIHCVE